MPDNGIGILFIFFEKLVGARKGNLVDVLFNLFGCHPDSVVRNC